MYSKVFISHSKDDPNVDFFHKIFSRSKAQSVWMEYEHIKPPPWQTIRKSINSSNALFVLLSEPLLRRIHTDNWVSYEIGLASNFSAGLVIPTLTQPQGLPVYVFEPNSMLIDFPVPYCNYYMKYNGTNEEMEFIKEMIQMAPYHQKGVEVLCPIEGGCGLKFKVLSDVKQFKCPACRTDLLLE